MMWKGLWLGEPQADQNLAPDVAGKWLVKTKIGIILKISRNITKMFREFREIIRKFSRII